MRNYSFFGKRNNLNAKPLLQVAWEWPSALTARPLPASMKPTLQALEGPGELASLASLAPPQALPGHEEEPLWHVPFPEASSPGPSRAWRGGFMVFLFGALCHTICTIKAPPRPFQGWGGASMAFKLAKVLGNSHAPHGSGLALINCIVADHSQL